MLRSYSAKTCEGNWYEERLVVGTAGEISHQKRLANKTLNPKDKDVSVLKGGLLEPNTRIARLASYDTNYRCMPDDQAKEYDTISGTDFKERARVKTTQPSKMLTFDNLPQLEVERDVGDRVLPVKSENEGRRYFETTKEAFHNGEQGDNEERSARLEDTLVGGSGEPPKVLEGRELVMADCRLSNPNECPKPTLRDDICPPCSVGRTSGSAKNFRRHTYVEEFRQTGMNDMNYHMNDVREETTDKFFGRSSQRPDSFGRVYSVTMSERECSLRPGMNIWSG